MPPRQGAEYRGMRRSAKQRVKDRLLQVPGIILSGATSMTRNWFVSEKICEPGVRAIASFAQSEHFTRQH